MCLTGGGSRIASDLLTVPGGSSTVLEVTIPYSGEALETYLEQSPEQFCSREAALSMAAVALRRALLLTSRTGRDRAHCIGVSCTAALVTSRPKHGEHRLWIAVESASDSRTVSLTLKKGHRDRSQEESVATSLILYAITEACGLQAPPLPELTFDETIFVELETLPPLLAEVRTGERPLVWSLPDGNLSDTVSIPPRGLLSGSFNPLHKGHQKLRSIASRYLEGPVYFEFPIVNADKPPLDCFAIENRRSQFRDIPLAMTAAPRFIDKARLFPGTTFVIGYDTAERVVQPRFYNDSEKCMRNALEAIGSLGCRFLVAGRESDSGFHSLPELSIPTGLEDLFSAIPEEDFREDISSTELREAGG